MVNVLWERGDVAASMDLEDQFGLKIPDDDARGLQQVARRDVERPAGEADFARGYRLQVVRQRARAHRGGRGHHDPA